VKPTDEGYPIKPSMIDTSDHFWDAFGHSETEVSARWIVRFVQQRGGDDWRPFTYAEIDGFYRKKGRHDGFAFNRLLRENLASRPFVVFHPKGAVMGDTSTIAPLAGEEPGGLIMKGECHYSFTHEFVARCFKSSPKKASVKA